VSAALSIVVLGCRAGDARWGGTMTDSAGVTIVANPAEGIWTDADRWTVEEELRIGAAEGDPHYQFGDIGGIAVDSRGRIFALDAQAQHIKVFSPEGAYEQTIGRPGGGPGELRGALALLMGPGDTLLVPDQGNMRINRFGPDGSSIGSVRVVVESRMPMLFRASASGMMAEQVRTFPRYREPASEGDALLRLASDGTVADTIMTFPSGKAWTFDRHYHFFEVEPAWDLVDPGEIVFAAGDEYRIAVYTDGRLRRIVTMPYERQPVGEEDVAVILAEMERRYAARGISAELRQAILRERLHFAEFFPAILTLAAGPVGTIWVQHVQPPSELSDEALASSRQDHIVEDFGASEWEVFDCEGRFLGVVAMPERFKPILFRGDVIYGVSRDELNLEYVLRLHIAGDLSTSETP
jgi:hypothetical protein